MHGSDRPQLGAAEPVPLKGIAVQLSAQPLKGVAVPPHQAGEPDLMLASINAQDFNFHDYYCPCCSAGRDRIGPIYIRCGSCSEGV